MKYLAVPRPFSMDIWDPNLLAGFLSLLDAQRAVNVQWAIDAQRAIDRNLDLQDRIHHRNTPRPADRRPHGDQLLGGHGRRRAGEPLRGFSQRLTTAQSNFSRSFVMSRWRRSRNRLSTPLTFLR